MLPPQPLLLAAVLVPKGWQGFGLVMLVPASPCPTLVLVVEHQAQGGSRRHCSPQPITVWNATSHI